MEKTPGGTQSGNMNGGLRPSGLVVAFIFLAIFDFHLAGKKQ